jgi:peptide deformylase
VAEDAGQIRTGETLDAEEKARRRFALAQIRQYPDPSLRMRAHEVTEFDASLANLADKMKSLMVDAHGVGLAATQVGVLRRMFVFSPGEDEVLAVVNPELAEQSSDVETDDEGCLSMQGVLVPVERSVAVTLVGKDVEGSDVRLELGDMAARVVQHEIDHLDGVLILDRTTPDARREAMATLREQLSLVR